MEYTSDQANALERFKEFLSSESDVFILSGYAGTGKTTLLKVMVAMANENARIQNRCTLMSPTGRAAVILSEKTGHEASTIHRTIYHVVRDSLLEVEGKLVFPQKNNEDSQEMIYFVDEASMVSSNPSDNEMFKFGTGRLLQDLLHYCGKRKVVFVGDKAQLPPVGQNNSPALEATVLRDEFGRKVMEASLKEVVRQCVDSGVFQNAIAIRRAIEEHTFNEFVVSFDINVKPSERIIDDYLSTTEGKISEDAIIVTYSNALALEYNMMLRERLFPKTEERLTAGDLVVISRNNYAYNTELFNGTIVRVAACETDCQVERRKVSFYTSERDIDGKSIIKEMELTFRNVTLEMITGENAGTLVKCKVLDYFLTEEVGVAGIELKQALAADFNSRYPGLRSKKNEQLYFGILKQDPYINAVLCKYGYSITCHKAQGGEWNHVFVDMERGQGCANADFFRWAYTAITRSRSNLWLHNAPRFDMLSEMQVGSIVKGGTMVYYVPEGETFMNYRWKRVAALCEKHNLNCHEDRSKSYQHLVCITDNHGGDCLIQMWYGQAGYSGKDIIVHSTSEELSQIVKEICYNSLCVEDEQILPQDERAAKLFNFVRDLCEEVGIAIMNYTPLLYIDRFYTSSGEFNEVLSFNFNRKGLYTSCTIQSTGGNNDNNIVRFRELLVSKISK